MISKWNSKCAFKFQKAAGFQHLFLYNFKIKNVLPKHHQNLALSLHSQTFLTVLDPKQLRVKRKFAAKKVCGKNF